MTRHQSAIALAKSLIAIDTSNQVGIRTARDLLIEWAETNGLRVTQIPGTLALLIETPSPAAFHAGFVTHLDVVPADGWKDAFIPKIIDGALVGRGAVDDKGPLALCLTLLQKWKSHPDIHVSCLIVTDEETDNTEIVTVLRSITYVPDFCLVVDGGTHDFFDIGQKGILQLSLTVQTTGGHSAFEQRSESAVCQFFDWLHHLKDLSDSLSVDASFSKTFFNISKIFAQSVPFGMPDHLHAEVQIAFPPPQTASFWQSQVAAYCAKQGCIQYEIISQTEPHQTTEKNIRDILSKLPNVRCGTTGGNNLAKDISLGGIPAVSHCPVTEYIAHCPDERMTFSDFQKGLALYDRLVRLFIKEKTHQHSSVKNTTRAIQSKRRNV